MEEMCVGSVPLVISTRVYGALVAVSLFLLTGCGVRASGGVSTSVPPVSSHPVSSPSKPATPNLAAIFGQNTPVGPAALPAMTTVSTLSPLSVVTLHPTYGASSPSVITIPDRVSMPVSRGTAPFLVAYALPVYSSQPIYILGISGMASHHPSVGADGSWNLDLTKGNVQVTASDTPACAGCAVDGSAALFKTSQQASASYGGPYTGPMLSSLGHYVSFAYRNHHLVTYGYKMAHGLEDWTFEDVNLSSRNRPGGLFFSGSVIAPPSDQALANTILSDLYQQLSGRAVGY